MNPYMNEFGPNYSSPYSLYTAPGRCFLNPRVPFGYETPRCISQTEADFKSMSRQIWSEHVNWTRMTITSIVFNLPDLPFVQERLLRNATDLANSIRPFYGDQIADRYGALIKEHLVLAAELVTAAVKGDSQKAEQMEREWYRNADEISIFWSRINPYLSKEDVQKMFYLHLSLTKNEAVYMIQKNYNASIEVFDKIAKQASEMADMFSNAIIMQFPHTFQ